MSRLLIQRRPGATVLWLNHHLRELGLAEDGLLALHVPVAAPSSSLIMVQSGTTTRLTAPQAGWQVLGLVGREPIQLRAEGAPMRVSGGLDEGPEAPAYRLWAASADPIPDGHWRAARILGEGAVLALGGGPARPFLRIAAGMAAWVTLPPLQLPPATAVLAVLRGASPLAELSWGAPGEGPQPLTLCLRAGAACEVVWEGVQLLPKSLANSA
ncbi:MAG: hypothetical protein JWR10_4898 [Rubritepida sp.]|nr:hypothetical protein [Rubritepida sp.]